MTKPLSNSARRDALPGFGPRRPQALRVIWVLSGQESGGVRTAVLNLMQGIGNLGWTPLAVALASGPFVLELRKHGLACDCLNLPAPIALRGTLPKKLLQYYRLRDYQRRASETLAAYLTDARPDAVHVLWPNLMPIAAKAAWRNALPCFWEMPNVIGRYPLAVNRRIMQWQLAKYRVVVLANSQFTADSLGSKPVKPIIMHLGADEARFNPDSVQPISRVELGVPEDAVVIGMFGRVSGDRSQLEALEAFHALQQSMHDNLHLLVAGWPDAPYVQRLRAYAQEKNLGPRLHLLGPVNDIERYYGPVDLLLNAYQGAESFGLAAVEAMMMAKPVLTHAAGGPAETVIDGVTGWHLPRVDSVALSAGIRRALADRPRWSAIGAAGREHAKARFTVAAQSRLYIAVLQGACIGAK